MKARYPKSVLTGLVAAVVVAFAGATASAAPEKTVSVFASNSSIQDVLARLAKDSGAEILLDAGVKGTMDLSLSNVPFDTALNAICRAAGLRWQEISRDKDAQKVYIVRENTSPVLKAKPVESRPVQAPAAPDAPEPAPSQVAEEPAAGEPERQVDQQALLGMLSALERGAAIPPGPMGEAGMVNNRPRQPIGIQVGPPLTYPVRYYSAPVYYPPPYYIYYPYPAREFYYSPVQPPIVNPIIYGGYGARYSNGGLSVEFSGSNLSVGGSSGE